MKTTAKQKAEVIFSDFFSRAKYGNLVCKAVRKTLHYSQSTMSQKLHYSHMLISDFENDVPMSADKIYDIYKAFEKVNYEMFTSLDENDYILYCLRVVSNYGSVVHEHELEDESTVKKYIKIFADLYSAE